MPKNKRKLVSSTDVAADGLRFVVAGLINTGLTILAYQVLLSYMSAQAAYAMSWALGLLFVGVVYPERVFVGGRRGLRASLGLAVVYAMLFLGGLGLMSILDDFGVSPRVAIFIVIAGTTLANFVLGRRLLRAA